MNSTTATPLIVYLLLIVIFLFSIKFLAKLALGFIVDTTRVLPIKLYSLLCITIKHFKPLILKACKKGKTEVNDYIQSKASKSDKSSRNRGNVNQNRSESIIDYSIPAFFRAKNKDCLHGEKNTCANSQSINDEQPVDYDIPAYIRAGKTLIGAEIVEAPNFDNNDTPANKSEVLTRQEQRQLLVSSRKNSEELENLQVVENAN